MTSEMQPHVAVGSVCSPLEVGADRAADAASQLGAWLTEKGCVVEGLGRIDTPARAVAAGRRMGEAHIQALALAPVSWFEDYLVLDLLEECSVPVLLWPLPGMETGALCGTQQITCYLKQLARPYRAVFGQFSDKDCRRRAHAFLRACALNARLRRARIGLAGHRVGGMTHTTANEMLLKRAVGPRVVPLDLPGILETANSVPESEASALWQTLVARAADVRVSDADGLASMRMYSALCATVDEYGLSALTVGCYPHLMGNVCLAASRLADQGVPFACEGDVNGAVAQLMLALLSATPTHHTDWLDPLDESAVMFTHCGSGSFELADDVSDIILDHVRLMNQGVCALFPARPGPVTLMNLMPSSDRYQCALLEGQAESTDMVFLGNPVRVRFCQPIDRIMDWISREGVSHHWMIGYGHMAAEIRDWTEIAGATVRLLEP